MAKNNALTLLFRISVLGIIKQYMNTTFLHLTVLSLCMILNLVLTPSLLAAPLAFTNSAWKFYDSVNDVDSFPTITSGTSMKITAAGKNISTNSDEYGAYYLDDVDGDFTVTVKITSQQHTHDRAWAGIMVKNDITKHGQSAGYSVVSVTPAKGFYFKWDDDNNGMLNKAKRVGTSAYPCWLKLVKEKDGSDYTFTAFYSDDLTDPDPWVLIKSTVVPNTTAIQDIGLFVSSNRSRNQSEVQFEDFDTDNEPVPTSYTITASNGDNGSISPTGAVEATQNSEPVFTVVPESGYEVDTVTMDSSSVTLTNNQYTFSPVTSDHVIHVTFTQILHTITASAGSNGSITPSGSSSVTDNGSLTLDVVPDEGYQVDIVSVDGDSSAVLIDGQYEFSNVTENHTIHVTFVEAPPVTTPNGVAGCATNTSTNYSDGFDASHFVMNNTSVSGGNIVLDTGDDAIDPDSIIIPFTQEVFVTFLYEGAGYVSDFGWMLKSDAVDDDGNFKGWNNIPLAVRHPLFIRIYDDDETGGCCGGGNGVFDADYGNGSFPTSNETALATYDDGTDYPFVVNGDGSVGPKDMKKSLGTIAGGTEIIFFLTANKRWNTMDTGGVFFSKTEWNTDTYGACGSGTFNKIYQLGITNSEGGCTTDGGWLSQPAITRMDTDFGVTLSGNYELPITMGQKYSHVIVGAPPDDPNKWILGWEDLIGGGDADHNDMVFQIERRTGGIASLSSTEAIVPDDEDAYFTAATLVVYDNMPCSGQTEIIYSISIDNGDTWIEITDWDEIYEINASKEIIGTEPEDNWIPGTPQYTKRTIRIDFAEKGLSGQALLWKAQMFSESETCIPEIIDVNIDGTVATHGFFSRSAPVIQTNVVYSASYETPAASWTDKSLRGHLITTRRYAPEDPSTTTDNTLWDAGVVLQSKTPSARKIYYPSITHTAVTSETLSTGDGTTVLFTGTLAHSPVSALTLAITDTAETFNDEHTDTLTGSLGGSGTINRFTGEYSFTFNSPPANNVPVTASYSYYTASSALSEFTGSNITNAMLGLDDTFIIPDGYTYDFDNDDSFDEDDGDWLVNWVRGYEDGVSTKKEWILGPIDHSVPAVLIPPGKPLWYYGSAVTDTEKEEVDDFIEYKKDRRTVVFVGSRDGMLHAFDGGEFRWGDNPETSTISETRGYFLWEGGPPTAPNYGTGEELWALIPANLIPRLKNNYLKEDDQAYVDASPTIADVKTDGYWKTVLLSAQGNGGDTVTCLDVTYPDYPSFMWEFADPDLFRSRSSAAVAQIGRILIDGTARWVAFFVSGKTYDADLYPSVYIVDIADGTLIERVYLDNDPDGTARGKGGVASGQPAVVDSDENGYIDRIYIGSDKGYMYKINIPDNPDTVDFTISTCIINTDFSDNDGNSVASEYQLHPIYASPAVTIQNSYSSQGELEYDIRIFFGTGDSPYYDEDINIANTRYHFFAYKDTSAKGECSDLTVSLDWYLELEEGHRIFASAFSAAGNIYFGTSTAETEDPCEANDNENNGKIYALDIIDGTTKLDVTVGNIRVSPLVDDKHLYIKTPDGGIETFGGGGYNNPVIMGADVTTSVRSWKEISE